MEKSKPLYIYGRLNRVWQLISQEKFKNTKINVKYNNYKAEFNNVKSFYLYLKDRLSKKHKSSAMEEILVNEKPFVIVYGYGLTSEQLNISQEREDYNNHPNICKNCHKPIYASPADKLSDIKSKQFCGQSCDKSYNNKFRNEESRHNQAVHCSETVTKLDKIYTPQEIKKIFFESESKRDFCRRIGMKSTNCQPPKYITDMLEKMKLNIDDIKYTPDTSYKQKSKKDCADNKQYFDSQTTKYARKLMKSLGIKMKCINCGYEYHCDVAHIKARADFPDTATMEEMNEIHNLVYLCPNCHWEYDKGDNERHNKIQKKIDKYIEKLDEKLNAKK